MTNGAVDGTLVEQWHVHGGCGTVLFRFAGVHLLNVVAEMVRGFGSSLLRHGMQWRQRDRG